ncbi:Protein BTN [Pleurostoma richardsiae]|uniref:Protein BTN n=1 Tax=Pleurostoma richardsiae TaxID=41990 RepID=A0AA38RL46_9PEZI|nr:Protein BTN [Pleurostoma richardsiae]
MERLKVTTCFFLIGVLIGLPAMVTTTSANVMFAGITGVFEVCDSVVAAVVSFTTPFFAPYISYDTCTAVCIVASALSYITCTLPQPLSGVEPANKAGPVIGTMLAGFVYAFGTNIYLAVATFFPKEAVLALSVGSGFSVILGPAAYIGFMAAFEQDWRRSFLVFLPTVLGIPLIWWGLMDPSCRATADRSRVASLAKSAPDSSSGDEANTSPVELTPSDAETATYPSRQSMGPRSTLRNNQSIKTGFNPKRTRIGLLFKTILPKYVLPLIICTSAATLSMMGTAPALQSLRRFRSAPEGDLQFQLVFLSYGSAQFFFSSLAALRPIPVVWMWTGIQAALLVIGIIQLFRPFLTFYGAWVAVMFLVGGCVGGGVTNTNYWIAEDFRRAGEPDEVRSFAMSFAGLGNFGGDAVGAALGVMVQQLATKGLSPGR